MKTLFPVDMAGSFEDAVDNIPHVLDVVERENNGDGFRVLLVGDASISHEQNELSERDLRQVGGSASP